MRKVKFNFIDEYAGFRPEESAMTRFLKAHFDAELSDDPDYVIVGPYGQAHLTCDKIKIFWTGENMVPDFNLVDYAIGFDHLTFGDRYIRVPLYVFRDYYKDFRNPATKPSEKELLGRKFCSFVVSNNVGDPIREKFYRELSKYKKVDSGGRYLNNVGGPVDDKLAFVRDHKFSITFENSRFPGYVTEKIMEAQAGWSVPIYWGDPLVAADFTPESMVQVKDENDIARAIEEIIRLDRDDDAYLEKCLAQCLVHEHDYYDTELEKFFRHIFEQPHDEARRLAKYGRQALIYKPDLIKAFKWKKRVEWPHETASRICHSVFK